MKVTLMEEVGIAVFWISVVLLAINLVWSWILVRHGREIVRGRLSLANDKKLFAMQRSGKC